MSDLRDVYDEVQRRKEEPWEPTPETMERLSRGLRKELGDDFPTSALKATVDGIGWTGRMMLEFDLDPGDAVQIPEEIAMNTAVNVQRGEMNLSAPLAIRAGVGAGFFTGLYVGLLLAARREHAT